MNPKVIPLHEHFNARIDVVGVEREPVIVIDNFLSKPEMLVEYAAANRSGFCRDSGFYPGVRIPCPFDYVYTVHSHLKRLMAKVFSLPESVVQAQSFFSIVTVPPEELDMKQRIPHYDIPDRTNIAMIHFLCPNSFGGTSFYRHIGTGFECIDELRVEPFSTALSREIQAQGMPEPAYMDGDTGMFQRIVSYGAEFNRALVYRSSSLHSGDISAEYERDPDPRTGRLSITSFFKTGA